MLSVGAVGRVSKCLTSSLYTRWAFPRLTPNASPLYIHIVLLLLIIGKVRGLSSISRSRHQREGMVGMASYPRGERSCRSRHPGIWEETGSQGLSLRKLRTSCRLRNSSEADPVLSEVLKISLGLEEPWAFDHKWFGSVTTNDSSSLIIRNWTSRRVVPQWPPHIAPRIYARGTQVKGNSFQQG